MSWGKGRQTKSSQSVVLSLFSLLKYERVYLFLNCCLLNGRTPDWSWTFPGLTQKWACGRTLNWPWTHPGLGLWKEPGLTLDLPRAGPLDGPWIFPGLTKDWVCRLDMDRPRTDRSGTAQGLVSLVRPGPAAEPFNVPQRNWMSAYTVNRDCHMQRHISDFWAEYNSLEESRTYTFTSTPSLTGSIFLCGDSDCFGTVYCTWPRADHLTVSRS